MLQGDNVVQLVVLCAEKPTSSVLKRVVNELPMQLKKISEDHKYTVTMAPVEGAVLVSDGSITVKVSLTSPLLREPAGEYSWKMTKVEVKSEKVMKSFAISTLPVSTDFDSSPNDDDFLIFHSFTCVFLRSYSTGF